MTSIRNTTKRYTAAALAFKRLARYTWKNLANRHSLSMKWPEVAITNELVYQLAKLNLPHVDIFEATNERTYGHDIDLRIEVTKGRYISVHLQAKVMYPQPLHYTRYHAIDHKVKNHKTNKTKYQWELLDMHRVQHIPFYLFYNGFRQSNYDAITKTTNRKMPQETGCSIMPLMVFKTRFLKNGKLKIPKSTIKYLSINESLTEPNAVAWHHIFDIGYLAAAVFAANGGHKIKTYPASDIDNSPDYNKIIPDQYGSNADNYNDTDSPLTNNLVVSKDENIPAYCVVISMTEEELAEETSRFRKQKLISLLALLS